MASQVIKVVHLITDLETGGAERMLCKLVGRMDRARFSNVVVSMTDMGTLGASIERLGVPVVALEMRRGRPDVLSAVPLLRLLRKERPDVLQTWLYHADLLGLVAGRVTGVPTLSWNIRCSDIDMTQYSPLSGLVRRILASLSPHPDVVIVNSKSGRRVHESLGYRPRRWQFIPNGFDLDQFRPHSAARSSLRESLGIRDDVPLIGLVARYDPMKDLKTFVEAAACISRDRADVHFVIAGRGLDTQNDVLVQLVRERNLRDRVHLLGERRDIPHIMSALDIFSLSSILEGFPNAIGEAMACEVPCVVTDAGDAAEIVGETGLVVPCRAPQAMAEAWDRLLTMPSEERRVLGRSARARIAQKFSLEAVTGQYEALYTELRCGVISERTQPEFLAQGKT